jgi:hypothetical protein
MATSAQTFASKFASNFAFPISQLFGPLRRGAPVRLRGRDCVKKFRDDDDKMTGVGFWLGVVASWNLTYSGDSCGFRRIAASIAGL